MLALAWKNILYRPLNLMLTLILFALGIGLISFLLLINTQLKEQFERNLAEVDLVVGAKGSPLQMILCSMYHIDAPTGNISVAEAKPFLKEGHPLIKDAVPLSLGDNYKGYRIVGTTPEMLPFYHAEIVSGRMWQSSGDVVIGAAVAQLAGLSIGDRFESSHGFEDDPDLAHDHAAMTVVGVMGRTGSIIDQLLLTGYKTVWDVHDHGSHDEDSGHDHEEHDHANHDHDHNHDHTHDDHDHNHDDHDHATHDHDHTHEHHDHDHSSKAQDLGRAGLLSYEDKDITSILIRYKNRASFPALNFARNINENTDLQAASPAIEINRLYTMIGTGTDLLQWLALIIAIVSGLSIFITLYKSMRDRKYELALMRVMGGSRLTLFSLILMEGVLLAIIGCGLGLLLSHLAMEWTASLLADDYRYDFTGWRWVSRETWVVMAAVMLGVIAAIIPAWRASKTDINRTLAGANR